MICLDFMWAIYNHTRTGEAFFTGSVFLAKYDAASAEVIHSSSSRPQSSGKGRIPGTIQYSIILREIGEKQKIKTLKYDTSRFLTGALNQSRTGDLILTMDALYLLSYEGIFSF